MEIVCTKSVIMEDGNTAFTKSQTYNASMQGMYISAINNDGENHGLGKRYDHDDKWFSIHFEVTKEDHNNDTI